MDDTRSRQLPEHPVEELAPQTYCQRAALELAALIRHQAKPRRGTRRDSAILRRCVEQLLSTGATRAPVAGPWHAETRPLKRPGRGGLKYIPVVTRGSTTVMVSTPREADELASFLNYCGTGEMGA
ncbi:MAG TPA: hypothetical protein VG500_19205 [Gemmatimonadales bacterium]|jgi:hypothetical protein|nr:hypothetical protein [Gemmatimonadales bacterium]